MQGVWVFASAAARDAAVTSPQEGNFAYLKDTNVTTYYTGSAWANLDTTGMTNPMTTTGDTIYSSSGSTPARLGIGTAGQVLQVNSGATAPEWATPAGGGGMTSLASGSLSGSSLDLQTISGSYEHLQLVLRNSRTANGTEIKFRFNNLSTSIYQYFLSVNQNGTAISSSNGSVSFGIAVYNAQNPNAGANALILNVWDYANTSANKQFNSQYTYENNSSQVENTTSNGACRTTNAIDRIQVFPDSGNWSAGTYELFGVK
jgi:hypothetical protein